MTPSPNSTADLSTFELRLRLRQQELVADLGRFALQTDDLQAILDEASSAAAEGLEARFAKVLEYLPGETAFLVRSGVGWKPGVVGHARVGADSQSPAGYAFRTGEPVLSNDLAIEPRFRTPHLLVEHGVRSAINVLIKTNGEAFGVLEVDSSHRGDFGGSDVVFLRGLANMLAAAIRAQQRENSRAATLRENQQLLRDKDLLVKEIHHRVTNSLQLVHSSLTIQLATLDSTEARERVAEAAARVLAIGAVHRRLYQGGSPLAADAGQYMRGLLDDMKLLLPVSGRDLALDVPSIPLSADELAHLGLITVELVTNALKHSQGKVHVAVRRDGECLEIAVSDEGRGFPASFDPAASQQSPGSGLGLKIVSSLARPHQGPAIAVDRSVPFGRIVVRMGLSNVSQVST